MTDRLDALSVREKDGKSYWTRVGVAFPAKQGTGWTVYLDAMPAPVDGQFKIMLREPQAREGQQQARSPASSGGFVRGDSSDDIPFAPEWRG